MISSKLCLLKVFSCVIFPCMFTLWYRGFLYISDMGIFLGGKVERVRRMRIPKRVIVNEIRFSVGFILIAVI